MSTAAIELAYVRVVLDRPLPLEPGRYVVPSEDAGPPPDPVRGLVHGSDALLVGPGPSGSAAPRAAVLVRAGAPLRADEAQRQRRAWRAGDGAPDRWIGAALTLLNRGIRAHRLMARDPYALELTRDDVAAAGVGCAPGAALVGGRWDPAELDVTPPAPPWPRGAADRARPGARVALALAGADHLLEGEELLATAVREANHGRLRVAAVALDGARRLLEEDVGRPLGAGARPAPEREALLAACAHVQDAVDDWRAERERDADPAPAAAWRAPAVRSRVRVSR